jgi:hypothetical protein
MILNWLSRGTNEPFFYSTVTRLCDYGWQAHNIQTQFAVAVQNCNGCDTSEELWCVQDTCLSTMLTKFFTVSWHDVSPSCQTSRSSYNLPAYKEVNNVKDDHLVLDVKNFSISHIYQQWICSSHVKILYMQSKINHCHCEHTRNTNTKTWKLFIYVH